MKYNFDQVTDRSHTDATKWFVVQETLDIPDVTPLWIADMDFAVSDPIQAALKKRMECPAYGYTERGPIYAQVMADWFNRRYQYGADPEMMMMSTGVMYSVSAAIRLFSQEGDKILIPTPAYEPFVDKTLSNRRVPTLCPMHEEDGYYTLDFEDMEKKIDEQTKIFILCNPQNPTGRVYTKRELEQIAAFCEKHQLKIIADEIHADFIFDGQFTPIININDYTRQNTIACVSCTKSFNLAGLKISGVIIKNPELFKAFKAEAVNVGIASINIFALEAMKAAYQYSEDWMDQLLEYIKANQDYADDFFRTRLPMIKTRKPEGTYFFWLDMRNCGIAWDKLNQTCIEEGHVYLSEGKFFGEDYLGFERLNLASPRAQLQTGLEKLEKMVLAHQK